MDDPSSSLYKLSGGLAAVFIFIAVVLQFFGFFVVEPAWIGNIVGWSSMFFYFNGALYYLRYAWGEQNTARNTVAVILVGLLLCAMGFVFGPGMRPAVKSFFDSIGVNLATGYKTPTHRGR